MLYSNKGVLMSLLEKFGLNKIEYNDNFLDKHHHLASAFDRKKQKYALYNVSTKKTLTKFVFDKIGEFHNKLAVVVENGRFGVIDTDGKKVIESKYDFIRPFNANRAVVKDKGKFGIIDKNDEIIIPIMYADIGEEQDGCFSIMQEQDGVKMYGVVDRNGALIVECKYLYPLISMSRSMQGKDDGDFAEKYLAKTDDESFALNGGNESEILDHLKVKLHQYEYLMDKMRQAKDETVAERISFSLDKIASIIDGQSKNLSGKLIEYSKGKNLSYFSGDYII